MNTDRYHIQKLKEAFSEKQRVNAHYSMRAFSRDLEIDSSSLGKIMRGERAFPLKKASTIIKKLKLSPIEEQLFNQSVGKKQASLEEIIVEEDKRFLLDESYYKVISEWEHYAVLELFELDGFEVSLASIASKLDLTSNRAEVVVHNLLESGLLKKEGSSFIKVNEGIKTTEDVVSKALQVSHQETLDLGKEKLEDVDVHLRDFSSVTVAIDVEQVQEAKKIIRDFRQKMSTLFQTGNKTEVYNLAIQLYPLSNLNNQEKMQ